MRTTRSILGLCFLLVTLPILGAGPAQASDYLGELCWVFGAAGDPDAPIGRLGISREGQRHYSVNGRVTIFEDGVEEETNPATGNLEFIDGEMIMTMTMTEEEPGFLFGNTIFRLRLDQQTRNGTFQAITNLYNIVAGTFDPPEYGAGVATYLPRCIVP